MSDIKFSCPHCSQHIACEAQWAGRQINCPACGNNVVIPSPQPAAPVARPVAVPVVPRISVAVAPPPPPPPITRSASPPSTQRPVLAMADYDAPSPARRIITWAVAVLVAGTALYFVFSWAGSAQKKFNVAQAEATEESGGGQLGHIAELNSVLAATEPGKMGYTGYEPPDRVTPLKAEEEKLNPPQWTLDLKTARIPSGKANGTISGASFVADRAYVQRTTTSHVLTVRQGEGFQADREIIIALPAKAGQKLDGATWEIPKDQTTGVPRVIKRWIAAGKQQTKPYTNGYTMKLEFGQTTSGSLPTRVFIALPDEEKTVVGGTVEASFLLPGGTQVRSTRRSYDGDDF